MTLLCFNGMPAIGINTLHLQKINWICDLGTDSADNLEIEIPIMLNERYVQQACISNLLVTVFAARRIDKSDIKDNLCITTNLFNNTPTRKELTAGPRTRRANTAP